MSNKIHSIARGLAAREEARLSSEQLMLRDIDLALKRAGIHAAMIVCSNPVAEKNGSAVLSIAAPGEDQGVGSALYWRCNTGLPEHTRRALEEGTWARLGAEVDARRAAAASGVGSLPAPGSETPQ